MTSNEQQMIEALAIALHAHDVGERADWSLASDSTRKVYYEKAKAALEALRPWLKPKGRHLNDTDVVDILQGIDTEREKLGALDGYGYRSGVDFGLVLAATAIEKRFYKQPPVTKESEEV